MKKTFFLLTLAFLVSVTFAHAQQSSRRAIPLSSKTDKNVVYRSWVNNDVRYIITNQERQTFDALKTDDERESFIEQFWLRRDPTPQTAGNEFRNAYYERIAYANQYYATVKSAGWESGRGRIYILYGKPDGIERTILGETWTYNSLPNLGSNVKFQLADQDDARKVRKAKGNTN